jgi:hypothetical protein
LFNWILNNEQNCDLYSRKKISHLQIGITSLNTHLVTWYLQMSMTMQFLNEGLGLGAEKGRVQNFKEN